MHDIKNINIILEIIYIFQRRFKINQDASIAYGGTHPRTLETLPLLCSANCNYVSSMDAGRRAGVALAPQDKHGLPRGEVHPYSQDPMLNPSLESQHSFEQQRSLSTHLHSPTLQGWFSLSCITLYTHVYKQLAQTA
jgi:hypothetical protein